MSDQIRSGNIRVPVEIVHSKLDFTINKNIKINEKSNKILDINWTIHMVDYQINLAANKLRISGKLQAEITYTKLNDSRIHLQNLFIPWKRTYNLEYLYPPLLPLSNEKTQYDFIDHNNTTVTSTHFEQTIYPNENPCLEIIYTKITTSRNTERREGISYLILDIHCEMDYRIWQNQIIKQTF